MKRWLLPLLCLWLVLPQAATVLGDVVELAGGTYTGSVPVRQLSWGRIKVLYK